MATLQTLMALQLHVHTHGSKQPLIYIYYLLPRNNQDTLQILYGKGILVIKNELISLDMAGKMWIKQEAM